MLAKKIFSLLGLLFIGNRIDSVFADECNVEDPINCISNVYYLVNKQDHSLVTSASGSGSLYYCSGSETKICEEQTRVGYYAVDKQTVYVCQVNSGKISCSKKDVSSNTCVSTDDIGKIYPKDDSVLALCLNYNGNESDSTKRASLIELNGSGNGNYLVYKNSNPDLNIFGITGSNENYAIVDIQDKTVVLNSTYQNSLKYVYADATTNRVMIKGDKSYPKDGNTSEPDESKIMELICSGGKCKSSDTEINLASALVSGGGIKLLKLNASNQIIGLEDNDLTSNFNTVKSNLRLFNCDTSGYCERINGYVYRNSKYISVTSEGASNVPEYSDQNCEEREGLVYKYTGDSHFYLCLDKDLDVDINTPAAKSYVIASGKTGSPFLGASNKMLKLTANEIIIDNTFTAENNKNYVIEVGTGKFYPYKYDESNSGFLRDDELYGVKNYDIHKDDSNVYDEYPLKDTSTISDGTAIESWKLFNCKHGECLHTFGYMKSQNENKYFKYFAGGTANAMLSADGDFFDCSNSAHINTLGSDGKICINNDGSVTKDTKKGNIFVITITSNVGDPFFNSNAGQNVVVEATEYSLTINNIFESDSAILTHQSLKISSDKITESNYNSLVLYDCKKTGLCDKAQGYAIDVDKYYIIKDNPTSGKYNNHVIPEVAGCSLTTTGKIVKIGTVNYLCLDNTNKVKLTDYGYYALGGDNFDSGSPYVSGNKNRIIKISSGLIAFDHAYDDFSKLIIRNGNEIIAYDQADSKGVKSTGLNGIKVYTSSPNSNVFIASSDPTTAITSQLALFDCKNGDCDRTYGYYKSGDSYLSISQMGINKIYASTDIEENECLQTSDVGKLLDGGKLCVISNSDEAKQVKASMASSRYLLSTMNDTIFASAHAGKNVVIEGTEFSFTLKKLDRVSVQSIDTHQMFEEALAYDNHKANIAILKCSSDRICEKINGYINDGSDNFYSVDSASGAKSLTPVEEECNSSKVGTIILRQGTKMLCYSSGATIQLPEGVGHFVTGTVTSTSSPLTTNKLIKVTANYIIMDDLLEGYSDTNYLIKFNEVYIAYQYNSSNKTFSIDTNISGMRIYQKVNEEEVSNVLKEVASLDTVHLVDLPQLVLFQCNGGRCFEMTGYLYVNNEIYKCTEGSCDNSATSDKSDSCTSANSGKLKIDSTTSTIQLCVNGGTPAFKHVTDEDVYFSGVDTTHIKKYIGNDKKTIIGLPTPDIGYFLINENKISTSGDIIKCDGGEDCVKVTTNNTCDGVSKISLFSSEKKICLDDSKESVAIGTAGSYIMKYSANSAFKSILKNTSAVLLIKMDNQSITVDTSKSSICVNSSTLAATTKSGSCSNEYSCNKYGLCIKGSTALAEQPAKKLITCASTEVEIEECSGDSAVTYCIHTDNKIYGIKASNAGCTPALGANTYLFKITDPTSDVKKLTPGSVKIDSTEIENLAFYQCSSTECAQIEGYTKIKAYTLITSSDDYTAGIDYTKSSDIAFAQTSGGNTWQENTYYKESEPYVYVSTVGGVKSGTAFISSCNSSNGGKLSSVTGKICISNGNEIAYGSQSQHLVTTGSDQWYINSDTNYAIKTKITGTLVNGANVFDKSKLELVDYANTVKANIDTNMVIYNCDVTSGKLCKRTVGYLVVKDGKYMFPTDSNSNAEANEVVCDGTTGKFGTLAKGKEKLCLVKGSDTNETGAKYATFATGYYYLEDAENPSVFEDKSIIRTTQTYMIHDNLYPDGIHIKKLSDGKLEDFANGDCKDATNKSKVRLISCKDGKCDIVKGYALDNDGKYYDINTTGSATEVNVGDPVDVTGATHCDTKVGKIVKKQNTSDYYLCLNTGISVKITGQTGSYVIESTVGDGSMLTINKLVTVTSNAIAQDISVTGDASQKFIIKRDNNKYYSYSHTEGAFTVDQKLVGIFRVYEGHSNVLSAINTQSSYTGAYDLTGVRVFGCDSGVCTEKKGYVIGANDKVYGNLNESWEQVTPAAECSTSNVGALTVVGSKIQACMFSGSAAAINTANTYLLGTSNSNYKIYKGNADGSTVVAVEDLVAGSYLVESSIIKTGTEAVINGKLITCTSAESCSTQTFTQASEITADFAGYYLNVNTQNLILCTENTSCAIQSATLEGCYIGATGSTDLFCCDGTNKCARVEDPSGYYFDKVTTANIIKCTNDTHQCTSEVGSTAKGHAYIDASDDGNQSIITCPLGVCTSSASAVKALASASDKLYFIDAKDTTKVIICSGEGGTGHGICNPPSTVDLGDDVYTFFKDSSNAGYTITCDGTSCVSTKGLTICNEVTLDASCKYDNAGSKTPVPADAYCIFTDGKVYLSAADSCTPQDDAEYLFKAGSESTVGFYINGTKGTDSGLIYLCDSGKCTQINYTKYLITEESNYYLYGCTDGICTKDNGEKQAYYAKAGKETVTTDPGDYTQYCCNSSTKGECLAGACSE